MLRMSTRQGTHDITAWNDAGNADSRTSRTISRYGLAQRKSTSTRFYHKEDIRRYPSDHGSTNKVSSADTYYEYHYSTRNGRATVQALVQTLWLTQKYYFGQRPEVNFGVLDKRHETIGNAKEDVHSVPPTNGRYDRKGKSLDSTNSLSGDYKSSTIELVKNPTPGRVQLQCPYRRYYRYGAVSSAHGIYS